MHSLRRVLHIAGGALVGALSCAVIAGGALGPGALAAPSVVSILLVASIAILVVTVISRRLRFISPSARSQRVSFWLRAAPTLADLEVAFALVAACFAVISLTGGLHSPVYPLLYGLVAFSVTFLARPGAWATLGAVLLLELALFLRMPFGMASAVPFLLHLMFIGGAASAHALFVRGVILHERRRRLRRLEEELRAQRQSARDYRLISAALGAESRAPRSRAEEEHILALGGVQAISASVFHTICFLKWSLQAQTCALLWMNARGDGFKIKELVTDSDGVTESRAVAASGMLGAIIRDRAPLVLARTKPGQIPYYEHGDAGAAFAGIPISDDGHIRGVLCVDRERPFGEEELSVLAACPEQILRFIKSEQVFLAVERAKYEHERFYHASAMLCRALTLDEVLETAFDAAAEIVEYDIAAITVYERAHKRHRICSVRTGQRAKGIVDPEVLSELEFRDNAGLASMVVKNKHYLPAAGEVRDITAPIYTKEIQLRGLESLVVLPLLSGDEAIGTFMLAARGKGQFGKDVREMLGIIANQVAVALQNGMMYAQMEKMATTDGLTGLTNHRTFQDKLGELLDRADRHGRPAAILLCDVDHFKKVNDTYGHPVGDEVLRQVARVLRDSVRKVDIPARYGGEEFAVVLEATSLEGAMNLADRIRTDVGALILDSDKGKFQVTMSVGVASFPGDARDRATLIERADNALYCAKETGRNRCVSYQMVAQTRRMRQAS